MIQLICRDNLDSQNEILASLYTEMESKNQPNIAARMLAGLERLPVGSAFDLLGQDILGANRFVFAGEYENAYELRRICESGEFAPLLSDRPDCHTIRVLSVLPFNHYLLNSSCQADVTEPNTTGTATPRHKTRSPTHKHLQSKATIDQSTSPLLTPQGLAQHLSCASRLNSADFLKRIQALSIFLGRVSSSKRISLQSSDSAEWAFASLWTSYHVNVDRWSARIVAKSQFLHELFGKQLLKEQSPNGKCVFKSINETKLRQSFGGLPFYDSIETILPHVEYKPVVATETMEELDERVQGTSKVATKPTIETDNITVKKYPLVTNAMGYNFDPQLLQTKVKIPKVEMVVVMEKFCASQLILTFAAE
ncbi:hypothetical protein Ciccas_012306 [Cichlidogyrus casuarinus]|uniref:Uncharacterized protein n=1 Tax=Cichlidogyrus casuarinus TaxID=1844966 RepID=A0ABD2PPZ2_9PLAT